MKKRLLLLLLALSLFLPCALAETAPDDAALLYLSFNEGQGAVVQDLSGHLQEADIQYQFLTPAYTDPMEPEWRAVGVEGGSLLFDGCSTNIAYSPEEICVSGSAFSISASSLRTASAPRLRMLARRDGVISASAAQATSSPRGLLVMVLP